MKMKKHFFVLLLIVIILISSAICIKQIYNFSKNGVTLLHYAAYKGDVFLARIFLFLGEDANSLDKDGISPLYLAVLSDNPPVAKLLITKGANVNAVCGAMGDVPLTIALGNKRQEMIQLLIDKGADVNVVISDRATNTPIATPLCIAAWYGDKDIVQLLLSKGAKLKVPEGCVPPLHWSATKNGSKEVAELLIAKGANINEVTGDNRTTPLMVAAFFGNKEVAKMLVEKDADLDVIDRDGETALDKAMQARNTEIINLLKNKNK